MVELRLCADFKNVCIIYLQKSILTVILIVTLQLEDSNKNIATELDDIKSEKDALNDEVKQLREGSSPAHSC